MERVKQQPAPSKRKTTATETPTQERKKRRNRPGTVALREIRHFQKTFKLVIPAAPFIRCVKQITNNVSTQVSRWTPEAVVTLQEAAEDYLVEVFEDGMLCAIPARRVTLRGEEGFDGVTSLCDGDMENDGVEMLTADNKGVTSLCDGDMENDGVEMLAADNNEADLDDMKKQLKEMEAEVAALREMQAKVTKEMGSAQDPANADASQINREEVDSRSVFVGNVDYSCTPEEMQQHFQSCGTVNRVTIRTNKFGQPKGYAYVEFLEVEAVQEALSLNYMAVN